MSGASRTSLVVAASIGTVEAMKDQLGVCRWNHAFRSIKQRAKSGVQSQILPPPNSSSSSSSGSSEKMMLTDKIEKREKGWKKVMDVSCFGPSTVRF
ncbi:hypothetical protein ACS0TY_017006 [Phlomoides rotata]